MRKEINILIGLYESFSSNSFAFESAAPESLLLSSFPSSFFEEEIFFSVFILKKKS